MAGGEISIINISCICENTEANRGNMVLAKDSQSRQQAAREAVKNARKLLANCPEDCTVDCPVKAYASSDSGMALIAINIRLGAE